MCSEHLNARSDAAKARCLSKVDLQDHSDPGNCTIPGNTDGKRETIAAGLHHFHVSNTGLTPTAA